MTDLSSVLSDIKHTKASGRRKTERTAEEIAQMPVYIRLTKAEVECLEDHVRAEGLIAPDAILTPALLKSYFMGVFAKFGVNWAEVKTTLRNPTLIRK
jgi:hypothetical protein